MIANTRLIWQNKPVSSDSQVFLVVEPKTPIKPAPIPKLVRPPPPLLDIYNIDSFNFDM